MNKGFAIKGPAGSLTCFTETMDDSIKWHVAGYEAFIQKRAVDPERILRGWRPQTEAGWSCVEAVMLEATENAAMALEAERLAEEWKARLEMATTPELINDPNEITAGEIDPGVIEPGFYPDKRLDDPVFDPARLVEKTETITPTGVGSLEGVLGGGQPGDPVDAEFDPTGSDCEHEWWTVAGDGSIACKKCEATKTGDKAAAIIAEKTEATQTKEAPDTVMTDDVAEMLEDPDEEDEEAAVTTKSKKGKQTWT